MKKNLAELEDGPAVSRMDGIVLFCLSPCYYIS